MNRYTRNKMYDHLRLLMPYPFKSEAEQIQFCNRFGLAVRDESKGIYNNKGHETLKQNRGVFIRLDKPSRGKRGSITFNFSLQKFYNIHILNEAINYNSFTREQANEAYKLFNKFIKIDVSQAVVKKIEAGFNVTTTHDPERYLKELFTISVNNREMRIIEDCSYKEYQQYSTNKSRDKRIVYKFYHKTYEAQSKATTDKKADVPLNVLRIEMDISRPDKKILFSELFTRHFQKTLKSDLQKRFIDGLKYIEYYTKQAGVTPKQLEVLKIIDTQGIEAVKEHYKTMYKSGQMTKRQYTYLLQGAKKVVNANVKPVKNVSDLSKELKALITNKIREL